MKWLSALWRLFTNPPLEAVDESGEVVDRFVVDRRERIEMLRPSWTYTALARELPCGCTRRWWGSFTLYSFDCRKHLGDLAVTEEAPTDG